jgi:cytochrome P450
MTRGLEDVDFGFDAFPGAELHEALRAYRERGPIQPTRFLGRPAFVITAYDALLEAFLDTERFPPHRMYQASFEPAIGESFISMPERERHLLYRKLATPAFRSRAIEHYEAEGLVALAHELVDRFEGRGEVDLVAEFSARFPYLVITRLLGMPREREDEFHQWALALLRNREDPERAARAKQDLTAYLAPVIEARRREPREDVISELVQAEVDGRRLRDEEIHAHVCLLFPTGGETIHATLGNLIFAALDHDGMWDWLRKKPERVAGAVDEILRWESSVGVLPRLSASHPVDFCDVEIPPDSWVLFAIAGANRDPAVVADPDRFDPARGRTEVLTFGRGVKSCPGVHLARRNLGVGLSVLLERLPRLLLRDREEALPRRSVLRGPDALRVGIG